MRGIGGCACRPSGARWLMTGHCGQGGEALCWTASAGDHQRNRLARQCRILRKNVDRHGRLRSADRPRFHRSVIVPLRRPTADTPALVSAAVAGLRQIFEPGYELIKAGVMLLDLTPASRLQHELALEDDAADPTRARLMAAMDTLNGRYGKGTVHTASTGINDTRREWAMRQDRRTPNYTTAWREVPVARA